MWSEKGCGSSTPKSSKGAAAVLVLATPATRLAFFVPSPGHVAIVSIHRALLLIDGLLGEAVLMALRTNEPLLQELRGWWPLEDPKKHLGDAAKVAIACARVEFAD